MEQQTQLNRIRGGLNIFAEISPKDAQDVSAEHDILYAGPDPSIVSDEKKAELEELGWYVAEEHDCFYHFV